MSVLRTYGRRSQNKTLQPPNIPLKRLSNDLGDISGDETSFSSQSSSWKRARVVRRKDSDQESAENNTPLDNNLDDLKDGCDNSVQAGRMQVSSKGKTLLDYFSKPSSSYGTDMPPKGNSTPRRQGFTDRKSLSSPPPEAQRDSDSDQISDPEPSIRPVTHTRRRLFIRSSLRRNAQARQKQALSPSASVIASEPTKRQPMEQLILSLPPRTPGKHGSGAGPGHQCRQCGMPFSRTSVDDMRVHRRYCDQLSHARRLGHSSALHFDQAIGTASTDEPLTIDRATQTELLSYSRPLSSGVPTGPIVWYDSPSGDRIVCVSHTSSHLLRKLGTIAAQHAASEVGTVADFFHLPSVSNLDPSLSRACVDSSGDVSDLWSHEKTRIYKVYIYLRNVSLNKQREAHARTSPGQAVIVAGCAICEPVSKAVRFSVPDSQPDPGTTSSVSPTDRADLDVDEKEIPFEPLQSNVEPLPRPSPISDLASPQTYTGVLLIYTHHSSRRRGIGQKLLDSVASTFSGRPPDGDSLAQAQTVAFSQMTGSGWGLACAWMRRMASLRHRAKEPPAAASDIPNEQLFVSVYDSLFGQSGADTVDRR